MGFPLLGLEEQDRAVAEVKVDEVLRLYIVGKATSRPDMSAFKPSGGDEAPRLEVSAPSVRGATHRASRSCRNCGRRCSARSGPFARQTVGLLSAFALPLEGTELNGLGERKGVWVANCSLDVLGNVLQKVVSTWSLNEDDVV